MKITKIEPQLKNAHRTSVFVDEKYSFSLNRAQLADSGLHIGREISPAELKRFKGESDFGKLYDRTLKWLALRARSEWEITNYLARIAKNETHRSKIATKLQKVGLVDDQKFAGSWVASRRATKPISRKKLWIELKQKHVPADIIEQVLADDETDEIEVLKQLIGRKARQSQYRDRQKLMAYLARQGFRYDQIKQALEELVL